MTHDIPPDMHQGIESFYAGAEAVVNEFASSLDLEPPPSRVYHYTGDAGLRGILESGRVWLTDVFNLNDPTELRHGVEPAIKILHEAAQLGMPEVGQFSKNMAAMLRGGIEEVANWFVCSFSRAGDDLGQWRAYADNGRGYALGFEGGALEQAFTHSDGVAVPGPMTFPITYGDAKLAEIQQRIITPIIPLLSAPRGRTMEARQINNYISELSVSLSVVILRSALFFKNKSYENEQEYRFFHLFAAGDVPGIKYRSRPHELIRYIEFDWRRVAPGALKEIIIGPAANRDDARRFVSGCLKAFHANSHEINITHSGIPYRAG